MDFIKKTWTIIYNFGALLGFLLSIFIFISHFFITDIEHKKILEPKIVKVISKISTTKIISKIPPSTHEVKKKDEIKRKMKLKKSFI